MKEKLSKAVALRYPDWADAPYISAKAFGRAAEKMLEVAERSNVPVVENSEMAEILSIQDVGTLIPEETYSAIAMIFAFVMNIEKK